MKNIKYLLVGVLFGTVLTKTEAVSWFRIQEMFRFQSFHMYGIIGSAIAAGALSVWLLKKFKVKSINGEEIVIPDKQFSKGQIYGGTIFGMGWALAGACPGPLYALLGAGYSVIIVGLLSAMLGTWVYSYLKPKLPH
ncbi:MAG: YeeE/YedE family protein [Bacteroidia bacterium]|nr:YeeE/YedE family protein [Bacteroidia bacterium]MBP9181371.1 YeeE/YedE family protein [Bacteroidia bacterium]MBP9725583.1 YeeE/YedE family protein [Bacteroidia bacterium]